jgi:alkylhydroperoxidase family enzyme
MARINFVKESELSEQAKVAYDKYVAQGKLTNMKQALLKDYATYDAFMGWYTSWGRLVEVVGTRSAMILAHAVSSTNSCILCSLFFVADLKEIGLDPKTLVLDEKEELLVALGHQIVKDPTKVADEVFEGLKKHLDDTEIVIIVGFAAQMIATNNFNSALQIDLDARLLPLKDEFTPATWRK